ncbi:hypothetical protein FGB62_22g610 [Gracilaria domingensis]|nr:hypothetical protein FGB62_22g610 [Gracilaria domingensis]
MTFGFITNNRRGSCSVYGHRESGESTHFANIEVKVRTKKRQRARETPGFVGKIKCYVTVSVWKVLKSFSSHSVARSFSLVYSFQHHLKSWNDAKILAIHDVSQVPDFVQSTCFGLALYGGGNRYGTVIGIVRESETILLPIIVHEREPVSALLLRGPTLVCLDATGIVTLGRDGVECTVEGFRDVHMSGKMTSICNVEDESYALACSSANDDDSGHVLQISTVHWKGKVAALLTVEDRFEAFPTLLAASLYSHNLFFSTANGVLYAADMASRTISWRTRKHSDVVKQIRMALLHNGLLILSTLNDSEDFYAVHITSTADSSHCVGDIRKLFSIRCGSEKGMKHEHLFIPWQNLLLKVNYEEGTCCDEEDSCESAFFNSNPGNPSMFQIESHLGKRLEKGLDQFLEDKERINDKQKMMENVRTFLTEELEHSDAKSFAPIFEGRVVSVASIWNRNTANVRPDRQMSEECANGPENADSRSLDIGQTVRRANALKLVDSSCNLDRLRSYVTIETQIVPDELFCEGDGENPENVRAKLRLHSNHRIPSVWTCNEISISENAGRYSLWAASPLAVFTNSSDLPKLTFTATIDLSNGLSHPVGLFTLASLMWSMKKDDNKHIQNIPYNDLSESTYHISASGENINQVRALQTEEDIAPYAEFIIGEHSARITLKLASQSEFSTLLATLTMKAGDNITFQSTPEPSKCSFFEVDTGLNLLEDEKKVMQSISSQKNVFGYSTEELTSVIEKQIDVDDAFGLIEEQQLWL